MLYRLSQRKEYQPRLSLYGLSGSQLHAGALLCLCQRQSCSLAVTAFMLQTFLKNSFVLLICKLARTVLPQSKMAGSPGMLQTVACQNAALERITD
jgi:hypothetical protein